ncbi:triosephosphate isomerase [Clostridiales bacterium COT073_COT-073]|nr:triosephosphate isomerase [Clostridiales bacterium COT073_COT-073]
MKRIYLNLKRFDVSVEKGGVNRLAGMQDWAETIISQTQEELVKYKEDANFTMFFPEAHLLSAAKVNNGTIHIGVQGVFRADVQKGGNFGAFTTNLPATAAVELGADSVLIGHSEERRDKEEMITLSGGNPAAVNQLLNMEVKAALQAGLKVLYCIGEKAEEQDRWQEVIREQIEVGLADVDQSKVVLAYEPIWAIGPGKTPPDKDYIQMIARFVKEISAGMDIVYGGGLKVENAQMLARIPEISGGLIALTKFGEGFGFYPDGYLEIIHTYLS